MDRNSKIAKNVPKMFQDSRCLTETPRFLDKIPRFPIDRNSKISEIPKPKLDSESGSIYSLYWSKLKPGLAKSDCFSFLHWRVIALPLAELVLRGSGLVPDFRVFQFDFRAKPIALSVKRQLCWLCGVAARARHGAGACCAWFRWLLPGMLRPQHPREMTRELSPPTRLLHLAL